MTLDAQQINAFGDVNPIKPGMTLDADIVQHKRAVWEWLLEPVSALRQRVQ